MDSFGSEAFNPDELDFLLGLVDGYLEKELDLNQAEWRFTNQVRETLLNLIEVSE